MAAPKGNQFWKLRSVHGRDKLFASPELLWQAATEYFNWVDAHPWYKVEVIKSGDKAGQLLKVPTPRPYTIHGLCSYLNCNCKWFNTFEKSLLDKTDDVSQGFYTITTRVREIIYQQKFEGAAVGAFNANIIARDLGLREMVDSEVSGKGGGAILVEEKSNIDVSKLAPEVLKALYLSIKSNESKSKTKQ